MIQFLSAVSPREAHAARFALQVAVIMIAVGCGRTRPPVVMVAVLPLSASVMTGKSIQFHGAVTGTADISMLWTASNGTRPRGGRP